MPGHDDVWTSVTNAPENPVLIDLDNAPASEPAKRSVKKPLIAGLATAALVIGGGSVAYAAAHKTVTLDVDGTTTTVSTFAGSIEGLLADQGVSLGERDAVSPAVDAKLTEGADVVVRLGREITFQADGKETTTWVTALDADEALSALASRGDAVSLVASRSGERASLALRLDAHGPVAVVADGATTVVKDGETLEGALKEAGITLGAEDTVNVLDLEDAGLAAADLKKATEAGAGVVVRVQRVVTQDVTTTTAIPFETQEQDDDSLYKGKSKVVQEGADGVRTVVETVVTVDGKEVSRTLVTDKVTTEPVAKVIANGTKEKPKPAPAPSTSGSSSGSSSAPAAPPANQGSAPTEGVWAALAQCESGGNPSIVSSNGLYHGLYQFTVSTWQAMGGSGLPSQASAEEQTMRAQMLQARSGWGQWPACARKLGLL